MSKRLNLILFGAGLVGRQVLPRYMQKFNVLALADNDKTKHGKTISGVRIIAPEQISNYDYDYLVLTSTSSSQIYDQLISMGFRPEKIKESVEIKGPKFPWDAVLFLLFLLFLFSGFLSLIFFLF